MPAEEQKGVMVPIVMNQSFTSFSGEALRTWGEGCFESSQMGSSSFDAESKEGPKNKLPLFQILPRASPYPNDE